MVTIQFNHIFILEHSTCRTNRWNYSPLIMLSQKKNVIYIWGRDVFKNNLIYLKLNVINQKVFVDIKLLGVFTAMNKDCQLFII